MANDHQKFMLRAIELSQTKMNEGCGGPFGAVIVKDGVIIAEGWNQVTSSFDPTAHAEVVAIRNASQKLQNFDLSGAVIYTSCEPCPMCLSAIYWSRIDFIYFGNDRVDAAKIDFDDELIYNEIPKKPSERKIPAMQICHSDAIKVFQEWRAKTDKISY